MGSPNDITVAGPPSTVDVTEQSLAIMAAESGVLTDYNVGSQIRTMTESYGSIVEQQGIATLTLALQTITYGAMSLFSITPNLAIPAITVLQFATASISPPPATQSVAIPAGTLTQTVGGIQYTTTANVTLVSGTTSVLAAAQAVIGGYSGNQPIGAINQIISGLNYPLVVTNTVAASGGVDAETPAQAQTRLAAKLSSLIGGSPVSVANAAIGVLASGTNETVIYSTCYEPWIAAGSGPGSGTPGFDLYVDNGAGSASTNLLAAVTSKLNGALTPAIIPAYRPAGMPYSVLGVVPVQANVQIFGSLIPPANAAQVSGAIVSAVSGYFTLPFGYSASQPALAAAAVNAALGQLSAITVNLYAQVASGTAVPTVSALPYQRVILNTFTVSVS